jgi:hypothetical protein
MFFPILMVYCEYLQNLMIKEMKKNNKNEENVNFWFWISIERKRPRKIIRPKMAHTYK